MVDREIRQNNTRLLYLLAHWLNKAPTIIQGQEVEELANSTGLSLAEAYGLLLAGVYDLDIYENPADKAFWQGWLKPMLKEEAIAAYTADPYYRQIRFPEQKRGDWLFRSQELPAYHPFVRQDMQVLRDGRVLPQVGFFPESFSYPAVLEQGREWMTLLPNETMSTLPYVEKAFGAVLTYGLGLGYFPFMTSLKPEVTSVTVVERSSTVISLFQEFLLPQFPAKEKIRLIQADALAFGEQEVKPGKFDYIFADIWHDVGDGLPLYAKFKALEKKAPDSQFGYWLQPSMDLYLADEYWLPENQGEKT